MTPYECYMLEKEASAWSDLGNLAKSTWGGVKTWTETHAPKVKEVVNQGVDALKTHGSRALGALETGAKATTNLRIIRENMPELAHGIGDVIDVVKGKVVKKKLPEWVLPVGIGAGGVALGSMAIGAMNDSRR